ncbi:outer membrane lipoprotein carrier protein [Oxalobacteraceae bacterium GrIS 1.18]
MNSVLKSAVLKSLVAACVLVSSCASAGGIDQFKAFVATTQSAKGDFIQRQMKVVNGETKLSNQSSGTFVFARPGKFIWLYQKPYDQLLQADGEKLYMYDKDLNQVTTKLLGTALSSSPAAILFGSNDLEKNFTIKDVGQKDSMEWLQAVPKDKDSTFTLISIGMQNGVPREMDLRDSFGKTTIILLQNMERNPALKPDHFKFVVPVGADIFNS